MNWGIGIAGGVTFLQKISNIINCNFRTKPSMELVYNSF